jgi:hypothetical protein
MINAVAGEPLREIDPGILIDGQRADESQAESGVECDQGLDDIESRAAKRTLAAASQAVQYFVDVRAVYRLCRPVAE